MSRFSKEAHPERSLLLRYIDGELAARQARQIEGHVEACWDCRAEIEELKQTVAACVRYRKEFLAEAMPDPPQPWGDLYGAFARVDRDTPQATGLLQLVRGTGSPFRWAVGAATAALAVAGALYFEGTPSKRPAQVNRIQEPQLLRKSADSGAAPMEVPPRPAVPSRLAATISEPAASISDELQVLKALHDVGADLGDPLRVSLSQGRVLVAGIGIAPERQRQIENALDALQRGDELPRVAVEFSQPPAAPVPADAAAFPSPNVSSESLDPFQTRLEGQLGGRGALDHFAGQALTWNDTLMSHAYALRSLAQQFPADASLSGADQVSLHALALDHIAAMSIPAANLDRALTPVLTALGAAARPSAAPSAANWQASAERLFQAARNVEMLSSRLLGVARGDRANISSPAELLGAVSDLRADLQQNQQLLGR